MNNNRIDSGILDDHWHLDKKVPLSLIFAMLIQVAMVIWVIADIKKDVEVLKSQALSQHDRDDQQDKAMARQMAVIASWLERIEAKLDRLSEARSK